MATTNSALGNTNLSKSTSQEAEPSFELFPHLPPELRAMVWGTAFPALAIPSRLFAFNIHHRVLSNVRVNRSLGCYFRAAHHLASQTFPFRQLRAINHETQALVQRLLPNTFSWVEYAPGQFNKHMSVRPYVVRGSINFRKDTDIIYLEDSSIFFSEGKGVFSEVSTNQVHNIGFPMDFASFLDFPLGTILDAEQCLYYYLDVFPKLQRVYCGAKLICPTAHKALCGLEDCVQYGVFRYRAVRMVQNGQVDPSLRIS